jgi:hypothetical protein
MKQFRESASSKTTHLLTAELGLTRWSYVFLSTFLLTLFVLGYVWWPLAEEYLAQIDWNRPLWQQVDWLLIGIFGVMTVLIMSGADLKVDLVIVGVGLVGGLVIESWGTQTELWTYYTQERPPLWIIPAWPIASLSIDRLVRILHRVAPSPKAWLLGSAKSLAFPGYKLLYWIIFPMFMVLMLDFVGPTLDKSFTIMALGLCGLMILTPTNYRLAVLTFVAGSGLGYFLERWGTTRLCWMYYTGETPPLFAVLAHGMAAVAFWRAGLIAYRIGDKVLALVKIGSRQGAKTQSGMKF